MSNNRTFLLAFLVLTLFLSSFASAFQMGTNMVEINDYLDISEFSDVMKKSREWWSSDTFGTGIWDTGVTVPVDSNGYPLEVPFSGNQKAKTLVLLKGGEYANGTYKLILHGDGEVLLEEHDGGRDIGFFQSPGSYSVNIPAMKEKGLLVFIGRSNPNNRITKIELLAPGLNENDGPIHPDYVDQVKGFAVLRFMDWQKTNWNKIVNWSDRQTPNSATQSGDAGVAIEHQVDLVNAAENDPWFNVPARANDNYIREMAKVVANNLLGSKKVYIEWSNEVWNDQFSQAGWSTDQGVALNLDSDPTRARHYFQGLRSAVVFKIFRDEFQNAGRSDLELVNVIAGQGANPWRVTQALKVLNGDFEKNFEPARDMSNNIINPYWNDGIRADAVSPAPYAGNNVGKDMIADGTINDPNAVSIALDRLEASIPVETGDRTRNNRELADAYGIRMIAYEGGQHLHARGNSTANTVLASANRNSRMEGIYDQYFATWDQESRGELFVHFNLIHSYGSHGYWGIAEKQSDLFNTPKSRAVAKYLDSTTSLCGNGTIDPGETCDDRNRQSGDGCSFSCQTEFCGDGIINNLIEGNEVCDGTALGGQSCQTQGFDEGTLACNSSCTAFNTSACTTTTPEVCDNGIDDDGDGDTDCFDSECTNNPVCIIPTKTITISDHFTQDVSSNSNINSSSVRNVEWDQATNYSPIATGNEGAEISVNSPALEAVYRFNGNTNDATGNFNGSCGGPCATYTSDRFFVGSSAINFEGGQQVIISNGPLGQDQQNGFSGAAWVRGDLANGGYVWERQWSNFDLSYRSPNTYRCGVLGSGSLDKHETVSSEEVSTGWHHVACTFDLVDPFDPDDDKLRIYIDGVLSNSKTISFGSNQFDRASADTYIGSRPNNSKYFSGSIDEVGFWSRTLSAAEIENLATGASLDAGFESNNIYSGEVLGVSASWSESNTGVSLDVSTDNGVSWCNVSNGGTLNNSSCSLGTGVNQKYRVNFFAETDLDQVTINLEVPDDTSGPECGNNNIEGTETCDGTDLGGQSCQTQGFDEGTLACNSSCTAFNTSACTTTTPEVCDNGIDDDGDGDTDCFDSDCSNFPACQSTPSGDVFSYKNNGIIKINGNIDDWEGVVGNVVPSAHLTQGTIDIQLGDQDVSAIVKSMWDDQNFYVMISVTDDSIQSDSVELHNDDSVELYLDGGNQKGTSYDLDDYQLIVRVNNDLGGIHYSSSGVEHAVSVHPNGYVIEYRIAFSSLGITPSDGTLIGFNIGINDDDDGGNRDAQLIWFPEEDKAAANTSWFNPSVFGNIELLQQEGSLSCGDGICSVGEVCGFDCSEETHCSDGVDNDDDGGADCKGDLWCQNNDPICAGTSCELTSAVWQPTSVDKGQATQLIVNGLNCEGQLTHLQVKDATTQEIVFVDNNSFIGNNVIINWAPSNEGQYFFIATTDAEAVTIQSTNLTVNAVTGPICGDGVINQESEVCDGNDLGGLTCMDHGFAGGNLRCADDCSFNVSQCFLAEICEGGVDEDEDGFTDCDDLDCSEDPLCASPTTCDITSVDWSTTQANHGDNVGITVDTLNCIGNQLIIEIWEEDSGQDDLTRFGFNEQIDSDNFTTNWEVIFDSAYENGGNIEYYLLAKTDGAEERSGVLSVRRPASETGKGKKPPKFSESTTSSSEIIILSTSSGNQLIGTEGFEALTTGLIITDLEEGNPTVATTKLQHNFSTNSAFLITLQMFKDNKLEAELQKRTAILTPGEVYDLTFDKEWIPKEFGEYEFIVTLSNPEKTLVYDVQNYMYDVAAQGTVPPQELIGDDIVIVDPTGPVDTPETTPVTEEDNPAILIGLVIFVAIVVILVLVFIKKPGSGSGMVAQSPPEQMNEEDFTLDALEEN